MTTPHPPSTTPGSSRTGLVDLAATRLGGIALAASDEFFAAKENLLQPGPPRFDPERYGDRGKEMDGWETRRRRDRAEPGGDRATPGGAPGEPEGGAQAEPAHDWCLIRLGVPGVISQVVVDTRHFTGNHPQAFALDGCVVAGDAAVAEADWVPLVARTPLRGDDVAQVPVATPRRVTHVRLSIFPDGGVARLRLLGRPLVDLRAAADPAGRLDLAAVTNGGLVVTSSDAFYASAGNLVTVGDGRDMSDGWETKRRRGPGHDWAVLALAATGVVEHVEIDTTNFKGNHPDRCAIDVACVDVAPPAGDSDDGWTEVLAPAPLQPHFRHRFRVADAGAATHLRLRILPDGGVARLRAFGRVTDEGWRRHGLRLLDAATPAAAEAALRACCASRAWVAAMAARRPFGSPAALLAAAEEAADRLGPDDWHEAVAAHPRIGERAGGWSAREQAQAAAADAPTLQVLAEGNRRYEERFGHVFLIRAAGRSAEEILAALRERLANDPDTELRVAAEQQREITRLRLEALLREGGAA